MTNDLDPLTGLRIIGAGEIPVGTRSARPTNPKDQSPIYEKEGYCDLTGHGVDMGLQVVDLQNRVAEMEKLLDDERSKHYQDEMVLHERIAALNNDLVLLKKGMMQTPQVRELILERDILRKNRDMLQEKVSRSERAMKEIRDAIQTFMSRCDWIFPPKVEELTPDTHWMTDKHGKACKLFMEGNAWCAVREDFADLQVSHAGFGLHPEEAIADLLINEAET